MPRRSRSALKPSLALPLLAGLILVLGGGYLGVKLASGKKGANSSFHGVTQLDLEQYLENGNSLRGNTYQITGTVDAQLKWSPTLGRILSVQVDGSPLPVKIPPELGSGSIQKGEEYRFKVQIEQDGLLVATTLEKI
jgi:hypothetical protein